MNDPRIDTTDGEHALSVLETPSTRVDPPHTASRLEQDRSPGAHLGSAPLVANRAVDPRPATPVGTSVSAGTVLIVDDSAIDRRIACHLIDHADGLGFRIAMASNGREALKSMEEELPAVVLTDLQMPELNGLALVRKVREQHPEVPVVLMTAHGSEEIAVEAIKAGAANYVPKKFLKRDLVSTLRSILEVSANEWRQQRLFARMDAREAQFSLGNESDLHAPLIGLIQEDLKCMGTFDATTRIRIGVAIQEALNNAMFHGNLEVSSDLRQEDERIFHSLADERRKQSPYASRMIHVHSKIERTADAVCCAYQIRDEGPGFDTSKLDHPLEAEDLMRVGGRGLLLIRAFMDQILYNEAGNQITMIKRECFPLAS